jgi:hypothetical protein
MYFCLRILREIFSISFNGARLSSPSQILKTVDLSEEWLLDGALLVFAAALIYYSGCNGGNESGSGSHSSSLEIETSLGFGMLAEVLAAEHEFFVQTAKRFVSVHKVIAICPPIAVLTPVVRNAVELTIGVALVCKD